MWKGQFSEKLGRLETEQCWLQDHKIHTSAGDVSQQANRVREEFGMGPSGSNLQAYWIRKGSKPQP